jgi:hypothetical protein
MRISKTAIWEATCPPNYEGRDVLKGVHYNAERERLEAADGFIMAVCPVKLEEGETAVGGIVPAETVKEAYKMGRAKSKTPTVDQDGSDFTAGSRSAYFESDPQVKRGETRKAIEGKYPNAEEITPRTENFEHVVTVDAKLLLRLARAICEGDDNVANPRLFVRLYKDKTGLYTPLIVKPGPGLTQENFGVIMPIHDEYPPDLKGVR